MLLHTPWPPGWSRAEPADGQECGQGSRGAPRPELRDLHRLPCCFHSGSDRSSRKCFLPRLVQGCLHGRGGLVVAVGSRETLPHLTDSENAEKEQSLGCHLARTPRAGAGDSDQKRCVPPPPLQQRLLGAQGQGAGPAAGAPVGRAQAGPPLCGGVWFGSMGCHLLSA